MSTHAEQEPGDMHVFVTTIRAKAGKGEDLRAVALDLIAAVHLNESRCAQYTLCAGQDPDAIIFIERFLDDAAIEEHRKSNHFRTLGRRMGEFMDGAPAIQRLTQLSPA